ncbi:B-cell receptor CD22-like isoform X2 [Oreochromis aureus]|uniref:B-cell receptor CD22-like isoform X2 n=1 Tax=Oreochromis aureus TaxID=47969 RepID=UPI00195343E6|nr:B-cell receptor CD22-like isoform X2 [Oreochromis aureus]
MHVKHVQRKEDSQISLLHFPTTESTVFRDSIFNTGRNCGWFTTCYMLCDLPADGIYETRGAAMSSTAAATGLVLFLLSLPDPVYAGRVSYSTQRKSCTLTIRDLRESDSAVYKFRFETDQKHFTGLPGVTLNVTALQVHVDTSSYPDWGTLICQSSCRLHDRPSYIWYKNGQKISTQSGQYWYSRYLNPSDSYSCAVRGHEASTSPSVCVRGDSCNRVNYSNRSICAVKGSSVDISSTYNSYESPIQSTSWFRSGHGSEDLREDSQYAGRVEVIETERGRSTLRIRDLTESDSAEYHFKFNTQSFEWGSSLPGTTLTVTDVQVRVSRWVQLDCVTRCNPYVSSYVWCKNGQQVYGASSSSYEAPYDTENSYSCALKGFEDFHSSLVCINGERCNRVNYSKRRICAVKGSSVDISSTYNSYESLIQSTSWFRSGRGSEDLREDSQYAGRVEVIETVTGRSTLRIRDLTESDSAQYHFKFNTQRFEWKSSLPGTNLTVTVPQVKVSRIISVHESQTEAELKCESSCSPAGRLSYVWFKNGQKNTTQQTSTYTDYFYPGDNISCAFTGYEDYCSPPVYAPKFASVLVLNNSHEIMEGSSVNLTCSSDANPAANYTWYKDNKPISTEQQLIFSSIQSSDSGEYHCTAKNELGQRPSEVIFINVKYAPKLASVSVSPSAGIVEGRSVNLTCSSDANPAANYTWYKENKSLFHGPVGMYHLSSLSSEDSGKYSCKAENLYGPAQSVTLYIDVEYPPKLPSVSVSPSAEIVEGSSVTLTCSSDANPAANYTWYKEDEDSAKASGHNFTITDFRPEHIGSYYCVAQNTRGCRNSTLQLIVTANAPNLTSVSVSLSGEIVEGSSVTYSSNAIPIDNYTWYKEDEDSEKTSGQNFTITDVQHEKKFIIESVMILNIVRLTLVVLMPIALFVLGLWMRKKTHVALETGPNESVNVIKVNTHADCENVSDSQGATAAQSDDTEEQEELL